MGASRRRASERSAGAASTAAEPRPIPGGILVLDDRRYRVYVRAGWTRSIFLAHQRAVHHHRLRRSGGHHRAQGKGTGVEHGVEVPLTFDVDMRFMAGRYVGTDGQIHEGQFGFI